LGCVVTAVHGRVAETVGDVNFRHGVMKTAISVRYFSTHSLRSITVKVLIIE